MNAYGNQFAEGIWIDISSHVYGSSEWHSIAGILFSEFFICHIIIETKLKLETTREQVKHNGKVFGICFLDGKKAWHMGGSHFFLLCFGTTRIKTLPNHFEIMLKLSTIHYSN